MDFELSANERALQADALDFARRSLGGDLAARDRQGPEGDEWRGLWQKCAGFGFFGLLVPRVFGGAERGVVAAVLALEALGRGCADNGLTLGVNGQIWAVQMPILAFGTEAQKARYLPGFCSGALVGAHGLTEAETGSDAMALKTTAVRGDGGYVLNGDKVYIGMGPACDVALVFASTAPDRGQWGLSAFLVEAGDPGFERGPAQPKMGLRSAPMGPLTLRDCWIPEDRLLGGEGAGFSLFQHTMEWERSFIFASHVGAMARQLDDCVAFARRRRTFGKPIIEHQSVANRLADMAVRLETSRALLYRLAWLKGREAPAVREAAMAKLHISEAFAASSLDAMRIHGGQGYVTEGGVERDLRDALGGVIYSGTSDIQRQIIARLLD